MYGGVSVVVASLPHATGSLVAHGTLDEVTPVWPAIYIGVMWGLPCV